MPFSSGSECREQNNKTSRCPSQTKRTPGGFFLWAKIAFSEICSAFHRTLEHERATVYINAASGDVFGVFTGKKRDDTCNVIGFA